MSPARRLLIGAIVLATAAGGYAAGRIQFRPVQRIVQPIAFNHKLHTADAGLSCDTCHQFYETANHSGLPSLSICLGCHEEAQTGSPEEQRIKELAAAGGNDVFRKLFRLPDHAFYSHRRHVKIAAIPCERCHGGIAATTAPPRAPLVRITMDFCIDCHRTSGVSSDCTRCHH
jgi:cytochrome c7-like protein